MPKISQKQQTEKEKEEGAMRTLQCRPEMGGGNTELVSLGILDYRFGRKWNFKTLEPRKEENTKVRRRRGPRGHGGEKE